ncbi:hypothetical protein ACIO5Z_15810 [Streptomyces rochei]|uniref:hypothetical protein n=1 Tax=Streptomyces TaxID=1883 RepID=UPI000A3B9123|nr:MULTISPECIES: hypothetical protein [Streptomyces]MDI3100108.1 hypothetical protein [Streptomyces sp. AN-3]WDI17227.1 hypothetical protein PS783_06360 [Streptomyces enissocaesilis]
MLRIVDARTGRTVPAAPVRRGPTRVLAQPPGPDTTGLRVLLVADLLVRALELDGTPAWALRSGADGGHRLREEAEALGIRPFEDVGSAGPSAGQTVHVVGKDTTVPEGTVVAVAPATPSAPDLSYPDALRLALLAQSHHARVRLDATALGEARDTLARWRRAVAAWARRPSRPVPGEVRDRLRAAWEDDVDAPGVLRVLRAVETDPDLPDGARFEIFAHADRFLGLHLARDVGAPD